MRLGPDSAGGGALLVAGVVLQAHAHGGREAAAALIGPDEPPFHIVVVQGGLFLEDAEPLLALVDAFAVNALHAEIRGMITQLPLEMLGDVAGKVERTENLDTVEPVIRRVVGSCRVLAAAGIYPGGVIEGAVAAETVEVHGLVDVGRGSGEDAHPRDEGFVVVIEREQLGALAEERRLDVGVGVVIGIIAAVAEVVEIAERAELEALVGIERNGGDGPQAEPGLDLIGRLRGQGSPCKQERPDQEDLLHACAFLAALRSFRLKRPATVRPAMMCQMPHHAVMTSMPPGMPLG